jgi:phosphatidylinositol glycan class V
VLTYNPKITLGAAMEKVQGGRTEDTSTHPVYRMSNTRVYLLSTIPSIITLVLLHILRSPYNPFRIPLFDDSPYLIKGGDHTGTRWDAIHFTEIASRGYEYEQQLAFQPGWQGVLWLAGRLWRILGGEGSLDSISRGGGVLVVLLAGWRGLALYK